MNAQSRDAEPDAAEIPAIRRPADTKARIEAELVRIFFGLGDSSSITVFLGILVGKPAAVKVTQYSGRPSVSGT